MPNITPTLTQSPIIAAVRTSAQLSRALLTPVQVIFLLGGPGSGKSPSLSRSPCRKGHRVEHSQGEARLDPH